MFVWVGLCSAQTSSDKYVLIDGCFFNGMPPGIRTDEGAQMIMLTDEEGHTALEIRLNKGKTLPDYAMKYRVSVEKVPGGEEINLETPRVAASERGPMAKPSSGRTRQGFRRRGCRAAHPGAAAPGRRSGWGAERHGRAGRSG